MKSVSMLGWILGLAIVTGLFEDGGGPVLPAAEAAAKAGSEERITRLQIFLGDANFGPGKIDGRWGEFTGLALNRYLTAHGQAPVEAASMAPADFKVDTASVNPIFTEYTVTEEDLAGLGAIPEEDYAAQAKLDSMPYQRLTELLGERFHCDEDFIQELNPGVKWDAAPAGTKVKVPNVARPFYVKDVKSPAQVKKEAKAKKEAGDTTAAAKDSDTEAPKADAPVADRTILVDVNTKMLDVKEGDRLFASFPITPGSDATPAPIGEWKTRGIAYMPDFRHDESMLNTGVRSDVAYLIPPGPNNGVGVIWIALSKDGIGIHGTHDPDAIGRNASHGCIRLANWDIVELAKMVKPGMKVTIQ